MAHEQIIQQALFKAQDLRHINLKNLAFAFTPRALNPSSLTPLNYGTWRFMGSYKWGYNWGNYTYNSYWGTYNPTYNYP